MDSNGASGRPELVSTKTETLSFPQKLNAITPQNGSGKKKGIKTNKSKKSKKSKKSNKSNKSKTGRKHRKSRKQKGRGLGYDSFTPGNVAPAHEVFKVENQPTGRIFAQTPSPNHIEANGVNETGRSAVGSSLSCGV